MARLPLMVSVTPVAIVRQPPRVLDVSERPWMVTLATVWLADSVGWLPGTKLPMTTSSAAVGAVVEPVPQLATVLQLASVA